MLHFLKSHIQIAFDIQTLVKEEGVKDYDACMRWAFGDDWECLPCQMADDVWNKRHGDLFVLYGSDLFKEGIKRIARAYVREVKNDTSQ